MNHLLIFNIGGSEFLLIAFVILIFFGAKGVPEIARSLGKATREFKDAMNGLENEIRDAATSVTQTSSPKTEEPKKVEEKSVEEKPDSGK